MESPSQATQHVLAFLTVKHCFLSMIKHVSAVNRRYNADGFFFFSSIFFLSFPWKNTKNKFYLFFIQFGPFLLPTIYYLLYIIFLIVIYLLLFFLLNINFNFTSQYLILTYFDVKFSLIFYYYLFCFGSILIAPPPRNFISGILWLCISLFFRFFFL